MKRSIAFVCLAILIGLSLTFSQVLAAAPGLPAVKKTPGAGKPSVEQPGKGQDQKATKMVERDDHKQTQEAIKAEKTRGPKKTPDPAETVKGKHVNFRGTIDGLGTDSLDVALKKGGVQTVEMDANTRVHIPTQGDSASAGRLKEGLEVSVHAVIRPEGGDPLAISINVIPGTPSNVHRVGTVTAYEPGVSITITGKDGVPIKFDISGAAILPKASAVIQAELTQVTIVSPHESPDGALTARAIVVHPPKTK